ncbi:hypothetical protein V6N13_060944 [Hibiscus sabdariffa]|uniref:Uncharacterized protein n=2 Tax=Hibiscus sabdariffa TaxID=183260 RepID=A0ABR2B006_9ROSI
MKENDDAISISNLGSLSEQIQNIDNSIFKGKWALIKSKLNDLRVQLVDFSDFPTSSSNPLAVDLLRSISHTLNEAFSLSQKCQSLDLAEGKLKTQSNIDAVLAKLDRHIKDSEILIRSGVLQDGGLVSSKTEAVRVESRNLVTRLQIGTTESKNSAMDLLLDLLQEDDKIVMIVVAQGVVPVLVRLLDSSCLEMKEKTVAAISMVSSVESSKHVLIAEGLLLLNHLLRVLESGSGFAKEKACIALQALSFSKENARAIGSRGGISSLLEICQAGTPGSQALAAGVLKILASFDEIKENFVEESAVFVLIGLAASGTALAQENSIGCLCYLVSDDESLKLLIFEEGGIECLRNFWDSSPNRKSLEVAVDFVRQLASCPLIADALIADGFGPRLEDALNCGGLAVRIAAARAVYGLSFNSKTRKEMGECGCTTALIKMLDGKAVEEKEAAAMALSSCCMPETERKQMVAAGACVYLQKLVEMNVEGAKRLLESLGRGKIWGVFARP